MKYTYPSIVLGTAILIACVSTPETGRTQLNFVPDAQMNQLGEDAYKDILGKSKVSQNASLNSEVVAIGRKIAAASGVDYQWEFSVIEDQQVNAFCLPGGKVAVYTGLIPIAKNNAGLAAVMGHEVAHAVLRHSAERMSQQQILGNAVGFTAALFGDSKYRNIIGATLGLGAQFGVSMPFSRFHEAEADRVGLEYMAKAGYDPQESVTLWDRMAEQGGRTPEILSTHPDPKNRARNLQKLMDKALATYNTSSKVPTKNL